jgi:hypothetical protein
MFKQILPLVALLPGLLNAAVIPFTLDGALDSVSADSSEYNTGGKISVNGVSIVIPKNLQFQFPAAWVGLKEIAAGQFSGNEVLVSSPYPSAQSILLTYTGHRQLCRWGRYCWSSPNRPVLPGGQQWHDQVLGQRWQDHPGGRPGRSHQRSKRCLLRWLQVPTRVHCRRRQSECDG